MFSNIDAIEIDIYKFIFISINKAANLIIVNFFIYYFGNEIFNYLKNRRYVSQ